MKIAFVGKGGSGKTTLAASFSAYLESREENILTVDADLNMHLGELLGFQTLPQEQHISHPTAAETVKKYLMGENPRIASTAHFKKTTPPGRGSRLLRIDSKNTLFDKYTLQRNKTQFMVVGTYNEEGVGASCYHNNLAILENVLSHTIDENGTIVVDMVAGVDAFASSLHAQFDLLVIVVEPTKRSIEVFNQYLTLAKEAGVADSLVAIGNKMKSTEDRVFISEAIPTEKLVGFFNESKYLEELDRTGGALDITKLESENTKLLSIIFEKAQSAIIDSDTRLKLLHNLHLRYIAQAFVIERFGDLAHQIDPTFSYRQDKP